MHAQFDYLKNTVSVVNDFYRSFDNYKVTAQVYDINSRKVFEESATVNLPADGVANDALTIRFPEDISQVHFIKLILKDEKGKDVSSNFYWRSNDKYEGKTTLTGPAASGFEDLSKLRTSKVKLAYKVPRPFHTGNVSLERRERKTDRPSIQESGVDAERTFQPG